MITALATIRGGWSGHRRCWCSLGCGVASEKESSDRAGDSPGDNGEPENQDRDISTSANPEPQPESELGDEADHSEKGEREIASDDADDREQTGSHAETLAEEPSERNGQTHESIATEIEEEHFSNEEEQVDVDAKQGRTSDVDTTGLEEEQANPPNVDRQMEVGVSRSDGKPEREEHEEVERSVEPVSGQDISIEQQEDTPTLQSTGNPELNDVADMEAAQHPEDAAVKGETSETSPAREAVQQTNSGSGDIPDSLEAHHEDARPDLETDRDLTADNKSHGEGFLDEWQDTTLEHQDGSADGPYAGERPAEHVHQHEHGLDERQGDPALQEKESKGELIETVRNDGQTESERLVDLEPGEAYARQNDSFTRGDESLPDGAREGISGFMAIATTGKEPGKEPDNGLPMHVDSPTETNSENGDLPTISKYKIDASQNLPSVHSHDDESLKPAPVFERNSLDKDHPAHEFGTTRPELDIERAGNPSADESTSSLPPRHAAGQLDSTINNRVEQQSITEWNSNQ